MRSRPLALAPFGDTLRTVTAALTAQRRADADVPDQAVGGAHPGWARELALPVGLMAWITALLVLDHDGPLERQVLLGVATVAVLALVLAGQPGLVRVQVLVVVAVAGAIEVVCSPILGVYLYRFHNVPLYVPPAHGLVYLAALSFGRTAILRSCARPATLAVLGLGTAWAAWGLAVSTRADVLGAFWYGCLVVFLARDRTRLLFVAAFAVVGYLELLGTSLGVWTWQAHDPMGLVGIGNPPSGVAGGYGWFDVAAMLLAPKLITFWQRPTGPSADMLRQAAAARSRKPRDRAYLASGLFADGEGSTERQEVGPNRPNLAGSSWRRNCRPP